MFKKVVVICGFLLVFGAALAVLFKMKGNDKPVLEQNQPIEEVQTVSDSVHSYSINDLATSCQSDDKIFCAIEQTVKCTMAPDLEGCNQDFVPGFVVGKTDETPRPTQISFEIIKINPIKSPPYLLIYLYIFLGSRKNYMAFSTP